MFRLSALVLSLCLSCAAHGQELDLGHVYAKQGDAQKFQRMQQNLQRLNPELAKEQPNKLPRPNQSKS